MIDVPVRAFSFRDRSASLSMHAGSMIDAQADTKQADTKQADQY